MSIRFLSLGALIALGSAPALATAAPAAAPAGAKPATAHPATRAGLINGLNGNFQAIDTNGDGTLSAAELQTAEAKVQQQRLAALRTRIESEFTKLDTNKDGVLSKTEFMAAAPQSAGAAPNGANIVAQLDKNKDGKVSAEEYRGPVLARFDAIDTNKDGTISDAERKAAQAKK